MQKRLFGFLGACAFSFAFLASPVSAAALSQTQISAITSLLQAFGASASIVTQVQTVLNGGSAPAGNTGSDTSLFQEAANAVQSISQPAPTPTPVQGQSLSGWNPVYAAYSIVSGYGDWQTGGTALSQDQMGPLHFRVVNQSVQNAADYTVTARVKFLSGQNEAGICARMDQSGNGYCFSTSWGGGSMTMIDKFQNNQNPQDIKAGSSIALQQGVWYDLKLQVSGNTISGKIWQDGTAEPSTWTAQATDNSFSGAGSIGFYTYNSSAQIDSVTVSGASAPVVPPASQTYMIASVSPVTAAIGSTVTVYGTNFNQYSLVSLANLNSGPESEAIITPTSITSTALTFVVPATNTASNGYSSSTIGTNTVQIIADQGQGNGGISNSIQLTVLAATTSAAQTPIVFSLSQISGPAGSTITIYGQNFESTDVVGWTGVNPSTNPADTTFTPTSVSSNGTQMVFTLPTNSPLVQPGAYNVYVARYNAANSNGIQFTVTAAPASTTSLTASQISAVVSLLGSFGANSATISDVQSVLASGQIMNGPFPNSGITSQQVAAITSLLQSFGASSGIIENIGSILQTGVTTASSGSLNVAVDPTLASSQISANTSVVPLARYTFTNTSSSSAVVSGLTFAEPGGPSTPTIPVSSLTNLVLQVNGSSVTSPISVMPVSGTFTFYNNNSGLFTVPANTSVSVTVMADIGSASAGQTVVIDLMGVTANEPIAASYPISGPTMTIPSGSSVNTPILQTSLSPQSQFVVGGTTASIATYNFLLSSGSATVTGMSFAVTGGIQSVTVGGVTAPVVSGVATVNGLTIPLVSGYVGTNIPVTVTYDTVGLNGVQSMKAASVALTGFAYMSGSQTTSVSHISVPSNTMTLVASKPTVSIASSGQTGSGTKALAEITVSADANGPIDLQRLPISVTTSAGARMNGAPALFVNGSQVAGVTSGIKSVMNGRTESGAFQFNGNGYQIAAGSSVTFEVRANLNQMRTGDSVQVSLGAASQFKWLDVNGNAAGNGTGIVNYPTNTATVSYAMNNNGSTNVATALQALISALQSL